MKLAIWTHLVVATVVMLATSLHAGEIPPELHQWLQPQKWERDTEGPVISLGEAGKFDDTHLFAPCVLRNKDQFLLWYSGSTGAVKERVFDLGLATSSDGKVFTKYEQNPVFKFGDQQHSILTATVLREPDGTPIREDGKLRMWFSSTNFTDPSGYHGLYESTSVDGITWSEPEGPLLDNLYAPTIIREGDHYRLWYTDVSQEPWCFRTAVSADGQAWDVYPEPILEVAATWEKGRLFYPYVMKVKDVYLMWYGSYWSEHPSKTAIGMAASFDGIEWHRNPHNPVLRPDPERPWESHYTTSQSVIRNADGSFRIWYASRKKPPFVNKYFAIGTATWSGPGEGK
ncbi:MAG: hypothetical protein KDA65_05710 [Planctomycetaceae bacterium]|nr:hypothetical protein [Planctomycetaceae bacterium]